MGLRVSLWVGNKVRRQNKAWLCAVGWNIFVIDVIMGTLQVPSRAPCSLAQHSPSAHPTAGVLIDIRRILLVHLASSSYLDPSDMQLDDKASIIRVLAKHANNNRRSFSGFLSALQILIGLVQDKLGSFLGIPRHVFASLVLFMATYGCPQHGHNCNLH